MRLLPLTRLEALSSQGLLLGAHNLLCVDAFLPLRAAASFRIHLPMLRFSGCPNCQLLDTSSGLPSLAC